MADNTDVVEVAFTLLLENEATNALLGELGSSAISLAPPFLRPLGLTTLPLSLDAIPLFADDESGDYAADFSVEFVFGELTWSTLVDTERRALTVDRSSPPYPAGIYLTPGPNTANFPDCWEFRPQATDSLVVDSREHVPPVDEFYNWRDWDVAQNGEANPRLFRGIYHQPKMARGQSPRCRSLADVNTIVLHETAGWQADTPTYVPNTWATTSIAAHFKVLSDGAVVQMYDPVQEIGHCGQPGNQRSVGIEIVNLLDARRVQLQPDPREPAKSYFDPSHIRALRNTERRVVLESWVRRNLDTLLPTPIQLDSVYRLVTQLQHLCGIEPRYGIIEDHPATSQEGRPLFLVEVWLAPMLNSTGMLHHRAISPPGPKHHWDGAFPLLYCWVRQSAALPDLSAEHAFEAAVDLALHNTQGVRTRLPNETRSYTKHFIDLSSVFPNWVI